VTRAVDGAPRPHTDARVAAPTIRSSTRDSFVVFDRDGDVHPECRLPPHGFFSEDKRFVSRWGHLSIPSVAPPTW
jgi:hypothetical protein